MRRPTRHGRLALALLAGLGMAWGAPAAAPLAPGPLTAAPPAPILVAANAAVVPPPPLPPPPVPETVTQPVVLPNGEVRQVTVVPIVPVAQLLSLAPGTTTTPAHLTVAITITVLDGIVTASATPAATGQSYGPGQAFSAEAGTLLVLANTGTTTVSYALVYSLPADQVPPAPAHDGAAGPDATP
ncbi:MAG: hypothetical protein HYR86_09525 [Candidatus Rokubacteria bacterium]|nr:hypothetical protein [Candidatus Rokubacteria bacterium]